MWPHYAHEIHPVELHQLSLEELTGSRPSQKGTLMYLKQRGIPEEAVQFRNRGPQRGHLSNLIRSIEHDIYTGPATRYPEVQSPRGRGVRPRAGDVRGLSQSTEYRPGRAMASRELMTGRRDGRAAKLFQQMRDRSDQFVIDESMVPVPYQQEDPYGQVLAGQQRPWQKSPWEAAAEDPLGLPDEAFYRPVPKPKPKPKLMKPAPVKQLGPPGYSEVDSIRHQQHKPPQPGRKPLKIGCTWKSNADTKRFHSGVRPYEMNYNRTARGWNPGQTTIDADAMLYEDDLDEWSDYTYSRPPVWVQENQYIARDGPRAHEMARSRQVVRSVLGPKAWSHGEDL